MGEDRKIFGCKPLSWFWVSRKDWQRAPLDLSYPKYISYSSFHQCSGLKSTNDISREEDWAWQAMPIISQAWHLESSWWPCQEQSLHQGFLAMALVDIHGQAVACLSSSVMSLVLPTRCQYHPSLGGDGEKCVPILLNVPQGSNASQTENCFAGSGIETRQCIWRRVWRRRKEKSLPRHLQKRGGS